MMMMTLAHHRRPCRHRIRPRARPCRCPSGRGSSRFCSCRRRLRGRPDRCSFGPRWEQASSCPELGTKFDFTSRWGAPARAKTPPPPPPRADLTYVLVNDAVVVRIIVTGITQPVSVCVLLARVWNEHAVVLETAQHTACHAACRKPRGH